ncbi:MAG: DNA cytosine methyltransferase, partial [Promethearchaeota archaeon]
MKNKNKPTVIDLFAGAGGISLGLQMAGYELLAAVEKANHCQETLKNNFNFKKIYGDITKLTTQKILKDLNLKKGDLDLLVAGPPCRGFSKANCKTRKKINPYNQLYKYVFHFTKDLKPRNVLFENVPTIKNFENGFIFKEIIEFFIGNDYDVNHYDLDASDFAIPQYRKRTFIITSKTGKKLKRMKKSHKKIKLKDVLSDLPKLKNGERNDPKK